MSDNAPRQMTLVPPAPHTCQECGALHPPEHAHDATSLFYQMHFHRAHGRWPTWRDAIAHCPEPWREAWEAELVAAGIDVDGVP